MKICKISSVVIFAIVASGCGATSQAQSIPPEDRLYGGWNCKHSVESEGTKVHVEYVTSYIRNGKSNSFGILKIETPELPEMEYSIASSAQWEVKGGYLIETADEIKLANVSHPEFDKILNLESMFPQKVSESYEILTLSSSILKIKSETDGSIISCIKV